MNAPRISRPERRADRDVLQVRVAAAQPAGRRDRLVEARVHAAGFGVDELRQRVDVGALQLHQPAPLENLPRQIVGQRQLLEHLDGRGRRACVLPFRFNIGSCSLSNRISASCFGELMLNSLAGDLENLRAARRQLADRRAATARRARAVDADAGALDRDQHRHERQFERLVDLGQVLGGQQLASSGAS